MQYRFTQTILHSQQIGIDVGLKVLAYTPFDGHYKRMVK